MSIYAAINNLKLNAPVSVASAQDFLNTLSPLVREQLISAIYLGREHIHVSQLRDDVEINRAYTDHIPKDDYAKILHEKGASAISYLEKLVSCAKASEFDLDAL